MITWDFADFPEVVAAAQAAAARWGAEAPALPPGDGTLPVHTMLEARLASLKGYPAALLFGSGYTANLGIISAIVGRRDWVVADRLAHASMLDAAILSRAELRRFRHNDPQHRKKFSGSGRRGPLPGIDGVGVQHGRRLRPAAGNCRCVRRA